MDNTPFFRKCVDIYEEEYPPSTNQSQQKVRKVQRLKNTVKRGLDKAAISPEDGPAFGKSDKFLQDANEINGLLDELQSFLDENQQEYLLSNSKMSEKAKDEIDSTIRLQLSVMGKKVNQLSTYGQTLNLELQQTSGLSLEGIRQNFMTMGESGKETEEETNTICTMRDNIVKALGLKLTKLSDSFLELGQKRMARKRELAKSHLTTNKEYAASTMAAHSSSSLSLNVPQDPTSSSADSVHGSQIFFEDGQPGGVSQEYKQMRQELDQQQLVQLSKENEDLTLQLKEQDLSSVTKMESSVLEISSMVSEIGMQLNLQNDSINTLANYQEDILSNVQGGNQQLRKANDKANNSGKWLSTTIFFLAILLLVIDYIL